VRRHAAIALGEIGADAQTALAALEKLQRDPDSLVRKAAKEARAKLRPPVRP
jgi:HEAT repeat protein